MGRSLLLIGLGGFGKWVVTSFKTRILDAYGQRPPHIDWVSFDLAGLEKPVPKYLRFARAQAKEEMLDYSPTSQEFLLFSADFSYHVEAVQKGEKDQRFTGRLTVEDAQGIILSDESGVPAGERRHASMIQLVVDIDKVKRVLERKLNDLGGNPLIFVVNSLAGGTGTGTFIDFLLLLRQMLKIRDGTVLSILLLPHGFTKVKINEDMGPLQGNCYAAFREYLRLYYPDGNTRVCMSFNDPFLSDVTKTEGKPLSDVAYIVDGSVVAGRAGSAVEYYLGVVPAIAGFIENTFLGVCREEDKGLVDKKKDTGAAPMSFDQGKTHCTANFRKAPDPYGAFAFATFGDARLVFDARAVETEFAQRIAIEIYERWLSASWLPENQAETAVKQYTLSEGCKFDKDILHDGVTKLAQVPEFATCRSLKARIESSVKFPDIGLDAVRPRGNVAATRPLIDARETSRMGTPGDEYNRSTSPTFHAVCDYYRRTYPAEFRTAIRKKVLTLLSAGRDTEAYGKGNLLAAEHFVRHLLDWYILFLKGYPERGIRAQFTIACELADQHEGKLETWRASTEAYYDGNRRKKKPLFGTDPRETYKTMRKKLNELIQRQELQKLVADVAAENLRFLEELYSDICSWISTFKNCRDKMQEALNALLEVRKARESIVCDSYITKSQDEFETRLFELITSSQARTELMSLRSPTTADNRWQEIVTTLPQQGWADFLKGFSWTYNLKDAGGNYPSSHHKPDSLICLVESGMPDFPADTDWSREEVVRLWNYELVEYYLTRHRLSDIENLTAAQVLMVCGTKPEEAIGKLRTMATEMLQLDRNLLNKMSNEYKPAHRPEYHYFVTLDNACQQGTQPMLTQWINRFEQSCATGEHPVAVLPDKNRSYEIHMTAAQYCLPAEAMYYLSSTEPVYIERMKRKLPPPLHIFAGEKNAFRYEMLIAEHFGTAHQKLHPRLVSVLEDETLVRRLLLAVMLGLVTEQTEKNKTTHKTEYFLQLGEERFYCPLDEEKTQRVPYYCDLLFGLRYPDSQAKLAEYGRLLDKLKDEINDALARLDASAKDQLVRHWVKTTEQKARDKDLARYEQDLYKVWLIMLTKEKGLL